MSYSLFSIFKVLFGQSGANRNISNRDMSPAFVESKPSSVAISNDHHNSRSSDVAKKQRQTTSASFQINPSQSIAEVKRGESPMLTVSKRIPYDRGAATRGDARGRELRDATVMLIDDEVTTTDILQAFLEDAGYRHFIITNESSRAEEILKRDLPDVLLTDLHMPGVTGFDILATMREHDDLCHIPSIVLTCDNDSDTKLKALQLGATDFLAKPVDPSELALRLRNTLAAKAYQDRLALYDTLTELPNRRMSIDRLEVALQRAMRDNTSGAVLHLNLDRFKRINDTLGHRVGDVILKQLANKLEDCLRSNDSIIRPHRGQPQANLSRIGGDEFTILLPEISCPTHAERVARRVLDVVRQPLWVGDHELVVTATIGIALFPSDGSDLETLLKHVDIATNHGKQQSGNTYTFYAKDMNARAVERLSLENQLRKALDRDEFYLHYQPKVDIATGQVVGVEALIRWQHPELGFVPPDRFIPLAEDLGLILPIGEWALQTACQQLKAWQSQGLPSLSMAVNVASRQFWDRDFVRTLYRVLASSRLAPQYLKLEITESGLMENARENLDVLHKLKEMRLKLSIDDFGTGYSSLAYLEQFPLDELKIDRSFVNTIRAKQDDAPLVTAIIAMAHSLGLRVVAEGVETELQLAFLKERSCDEYQGYLYSKPVAADDFVLLLAQAQPAVNSAST